MCVSYVLGSPFICARTPDADRTTIRRLFTMQRRLLVLYRRRLSCRGLANSEIKLRRPSRCRQEQQQPYSQHVRVSAERHVLTPVAPEARLRGQGPIPMTPRVTRQASAQAPREENTRRENHHRTLLRCVQWQTVADGCAKRARSFSFTAVSVFYIALNV